MSITTSNNFHSYHKRVFCDQSVGKDDDISKMAKLNISMKVKNIKEMVNALSSDTHEYNFIVVCGHGRIGCQGLGSNTSEKYIYGCDFDVNHISDIESDLEEIRQILDISKKPLPVLFFAGCEVGANPALIKKISKIVTNVLIVASADALTYRLNSNGRKVEILKLVKGNVHKSPIDFQFVLNGSILSFSKIQSKTGHEPSLLEQELTNYQQQ
jgi:hypothetical protein